MATRYIQRRSGLAPNDVSRPHANAIFVDSDDEQIKYTTGTSGTTTKTVGGLAAVEAVTAANTITAEESGKTFFLNLAGGFDNVLPAKAAGLKYTFIVKTAPSGANYTITATDADTILGHVLTSGFNDSPADIETSGGADVINFVDGVAAAGDWVEVICDGTNWYARGTCAVEAGITFTG